MMRQLRASYLLFVNVPGLDCSGRHHVKIFQKVSRPVRLRYLPSNLESYGAIHVLVKAKAYFPQMSLVMYPTLVKLVSLFELPGGHI